MNNAYRHALACLGDPPSVVWLVQSAQMMRTAPRWRDRSAKNAWERRPAFRSGALERYFACNSEQEKKWDLTEPKRVLALYPDDPRAKRLFEEFVPDKEKRDGLLSIAREFGKAGLHAGRDFVTTLE